MLVEVQGPDTNARPTGDLLRSIFHPAHNYTSARVRNVGGAASTLTDPLGQPVKLNGSTWEFVVAADIANADGVCLHDKPLAEIADDGYTPTEVLLLTKGPAVLHEDALPATDCVGASINAANFEAALVALGFSFMSGPTLTSTPSRVIFLRELTGTLIFCLPNLISIIE